MPAVTLSEVLATSDVPGGVINILTGRTAEIAPWLASHMDVNAIDLTGARNVAVAADCREPATADRFMSCRVGSCCTELRVIRVR